MKKLLFVFVLLNFVTGCISPSAPSESKLPFHYSGQWGWRNIDSSVIQSYRCSFVLNERDAAFAGVYTDSLGVNASLDGKDSNGIYFCQWNHSGKFNHKVIFSGNDFIIVPPYASVFYTFKKE